MRSMKLITLSMGAAILFAGLQPAEAGPPPPPSGIIGVAGGTMFSVWDQNTGMMNCDVLHPNPDWVYRRAIRVISQNLFYVTSSPREEDSADGWIDVFTPNCLLVGRIGQLDAADPMLEGPEAITLVEGPLGSIPNILVANRNCSANSCVDTGLMIQATPPWNVFPVNFPDCNGPSGLKQMPAPGGAPPGNVLVVCNEGIQIMSPFFPYPTSSPAPPTDTFLFDATTDGNRFYVSSDAMDRHGKAPAEVHMYDPNGLPIGTLPVGDGTKLCTDARYGGNSAVECSHIGGMSCGPNGGLGPECWMAQRGRTGVTPYGVGDYVVSGVQLYKEDLFGPYSCKEAKDVLKQPAGPPRTGDDVTFTCNGSKILVDGTPSFPVGAFPPDKNPGSAPAWTPHDKRLDDAGLSTPGFLLRFNVAAGLWPPVATFLGIGPLPMAGDHQLAKEE